VITNYSTLVPEKLAYLISISVCICCTLRMSTTLLNEYGMVWYGTPV